MTAGGQVEIVLPEQPPGLAESERLRRLRSELDGWLGKVNDLAALEDGLSGEVRGRVERALGCVLRREAGWGREWAWLRGEAGLRLAGALDGWLAAGDALRVAETKAIERAQAKARKASLKKSTKLQAPTSREEPNSKGPGEGKAE